MRTFVRWAIAIAGLALLGVPAVDAHEHPHHRTAGRTHSRDPDHDSG